MILTGIYNKEGRLKGSTGSRCSSGVMSYDVVRFGATGGEDMRLLSAWQ